MQYVFSFQWVVPMIIGSACEKRGILVNQCIISPPSKLKAKSFISHICCVCTIALDMSHYSFN